MNDLEIFGDRVMRRRTELGLSQSELSLRIGYTSRSSINKLEKGLVDVPLTKIKALARVLMISEAWLLGNDIPTNEKKSTAEAVDLDDPLSKEREELMNSLSPAQKDDLARYARYLASQEDKDKA